MATDEFLDELEKHSDGLEQYASAGEPGHPEPIKPNDTDKAGIKEVINRLIDRIEQNASTERIGLKTGFRFIDNSIFGLVPTFLYVVGGYTSVGKTALMTQTIVNCLANNKDIKLAVFSTEMSSEQILLRILANATGIGSLQIYSGKLTQDEALKVQNVQERLSDKDLWFYDDVYTFQEINDRCEIIRPDVVFVDYLQNMRGSGSIYERMSLIPVQLQEMAKTLNTAVVAMSQISNEAARGKDDLIAFKGAGEISAACDFGIWLSRDPDNEGLLECFVRKNRHGPKGQSRLHNVV